MTVKTKPGHGGHRAGSGRRRRDTRQVTLRLSPATITRLHKRAAELGVSLSQLTEGRLKDV
jgi:hypothetical protein